MDAQNLSVTNLSIEDLAAATARRTVEGLRPLIRQVIKEMSSLPERPTVKQISRYLGVSEVTVHKYFNEGRLTRDKIGSRTRGRREEVFALLQEIEN